MERLKTRVTPILLLAFILTLPGLCHAEDDGFREVFKDALYGGLTGALVGAACIVFTRHPADHLSTIGYGAGAGVLVGTAYGVVKSTRSLAEVENGKVKFAIPTVLPEFREGRKEVALGFSAGIFRGTF